MDNLIQEIQETNNGTKNKAVIEILKFVLEVRDLGGGDRLENRRGLSIVGGGNIF